MPKTYQPQRKRQALDLLAAYNRLSTVRRLSGISVNTLRRWREEAAPKDADLSQEKIFSVP